MCGHTRRDKIKSEDIRDKVVVANIVGKMRGTRLRWFGHVRYPKVVKKRERLAMTGMRRGTGSPNKYWGEIITLDMTHVQLINEMTLDRRYVRIKVEDW